MPQTFTGITTKEAKELLNQYGKNEIEDRNKVTPLQILLRQVKSNFMVYMLFIAAVVSFLVNKNITGYTILAVILAVIFVGFLQEYKAEEAIGSLKKMLMPVSIAMRDGHKIEIPSEEIVPSDILILGNGEKIPADCILLQSRDLRVNESALTGESKDVSKVEVSDEEDPKEDNLLFMGTFIVNGKCIARVVHTGMNTKFGEIAHLISGAEKELPLQKKVNAIARVMVVVAIVFSITTAILTILSATTINQEVLIEALILMIAISVSAFPEGLPVVLITTLAVGAKKMSDKNVIVNRMSIIETLGETTVICTDKTGTITRGEMTIKFIYTDDSLFEIEGTGYIAHGDFMKNDKVINPSENPTLKLLIESGVVCNDAQIERSGEDYEFNGLGTPTEVALLVLGSKAGLYKEDYNGEVLSEYPFNSERKMMSVLYQGDDQKPRVYAKGAPEILLEKCNKVLIKGQVVKFDNKLRENLEKMQLEMAGHAFRTLALAYKDISSESDRSYDEDDFVFLGVVSMEDSPREEVAGALELATKAGIKVKMITGDNKETALAIAKKIGMTGDVITGREIDELSDDELSVVIKDTQVFARVTPEHKIRIVRLLKGHGEIVAMTGDGVNDAPALKEAHVGIAMGKKGTDVTRATADLILKDENFSNIVEAVKGGRAIYNNIRKFVTYQLSVNIAELIVLLVGVILAPSLGWQVPLLLSIQILFVNLVTDNIPAITLGLNPSSDDIMYEPPRKSSTILNKSLFLLIGFSGGIMALFTLFSYYLDFNVFGETSVHARTTALLTLIILEILGAFSFRSFRKRVLNRSPFVNLSLVYASLISIGATLIIIYFPPAKTIFETTSARWTSWLIAGSLSFALAIIFDIAKHYVNKNSQYVRDTR